jgi:hypothetical protein
MEILAGTKFLDKEYAAVKKRTVKPAILILTVCHGGCDGG